jgi:hypothetical protein
MLSRLALGGWAESVFLELRAFWTSSLSQCKFPDHAVALPAHLDVKSQRQTVHIAFDDSGWF